MSGAQRVGVARSGAETHVIVEHTPCRYVEGVLGWLKALDVAPDQVGIRQWS